MDKRKEDDFTGVLTDLTFRGGDILPVASALTNSAGVYYCEQAEDGPKYVATFARVDDRGMTWVDIFGAKLEGTMIVLDISGAGSKFLGRNPEEDEKRREAVDMIKRWLGAHV